MTLWMTPVRDTMLAGRWSGMLAGGVASTRTGTTSTRRRPVPYLTEGTARSQVEVFCSVISMSYRLLSHSR